MYKIGVFALINCTTKRALRYYEKEGLLIPKLFDGKCRYYDDVNSKLYQRLFL